MNCDKYEMLLSAYIDKEVNDEEIKMVEEHIKECKKCKAKLEELQELTCLIKQEFGDLKPKDNVKRDIYKRLYRDFFIMFVGLVICFAVISIGGGVIQLVFLNDIPAELTYIFYAGIGLVLVGILFLMYDIYVNIIKIIKSK